MHHGREPFARPLLDFRMPLLWFSREGGAGSVPAPVRSLLDLFFDIFCQRRFLPTRELIFQLELSSHAGKTAVFDSKKQGFRLPVFFTVFNIL